MAYSLNEKEGITMKEVFKGDQGLTCIFTDDGISLYTKSKEGFYPFGCMKSLKYNFLDVLEIDFGKSSATFCAHKEDRDRMKEAVRVAQQILKDAPEDEPKIFHRGFRVSPSLPPEEQLKKYKELFIAGTLTKDHYDLMKRLLKP